MRISVIIDALSEPRAAHLEYPGVAELGSEATAAGGGNREPSEWPRSKKSRHGVSADDFFGNRNRKRAALSKAGQTRCTFPQNIKPIQYPGVAQLVARLLWEQDAGSSSLPTRTKKTDTAFAVSVFFFDGRVAFFLPVFAKYSIMDVTSMPRNSTT